MESHSELKYAEGFYCRKLVLIDLMPPSKSAFFLNPRKVIS